MVGALQARLGPGWAAFAGTTDFVDEPTHLSEIVVGPAATPGDVIWLARANPDGWWPTFETAGTLDRLDDLAPHVVLAETDRFAFLTDADVGVHGIVFESLRATCWGTVDTTPTRVTCRWD